MSWRQREVLSNAPPSTPGLPIWEARCKIPCASLRSTRSEFASRDSDPGNPWRFPARNRTTLLCHPREPLQSSAYHFTAPAKRHTISRRLRLMPGATSVAQCGHCPASHPARDPDYHLVTFSGHLRELTLPLTQIANPGRVRLVKKKYSSFLTRRSLPARTTSRKAVVCPSRNRMLPRALKYWMLMLCIPSASPKPLA